MDDDAKLWLCISHPNVIKKKELLRRVLIEVVVKEAIKLRDQVVESSFRYDGAAADEATRARKLAEAKAKAKIGLTFDGEAMFLDTILTIFASPDACPGLQSFVLVKLPAACSMTQQPLDVSPCFLTAKATLTSLLNENKQGMRQPYLHRAEAALSTLLLPSRTVFLRWLSLLPNILSTAFQISHVQKGWRLTGLHPFDTCQIMSMSTAFTKISPAASTACRCAMEKLAPIMLQKGQVTDAEIQAAVGTALMFSVKETQNAKGKKTHKDTHEMALNRRRAVIVSNPNILKERDAALSKRKRTSSSAKVSCVTA